MVRAVADAGRGGTGTARACFARRRRRERSAAALARPYCAATAFSAAGMRWASSWIVSALRLETSTVPSRSTTSPRGAGKGMSRTRLLLASARYWSPESTWRNHSRKKTIAKRVNATPPKIATRSASCGVIAGRRSSEPPITAA